MEMISLVFFLYMQFLLLLLIGLSFFYSRVGILEMMTFGSQKHVGPLLNLHVILTSIKIRDLKLQSPFSNANFLFITNQSCYNFLTDHFRINQNINDGFIFYCFIFYKEDCLLCSISVIIVLHHLHNVYVLLCTMHCANKHFFATYSKKDLRNDNAQRHL